MAHCLTLYFLGAGRALYIEAATLDAACNALSVAIAGLPDGKRDQVAKWSRDICTAIGRRPPHYERMSCEHGQLGLAYHSGSQDRAFARRMMAGPYGLKDYPGVDYSVDVLATEGAE